MCRLTASLGVALLLALVIPAFAEGDGGPNAFKDARFSAVDIYVDPEEHTSAAYQFEILADGGTVKIVGVEGGEHPAFEEPPYYDPQALKTGRIILAAFNTGKNLPDTRTRVARVHLMISGDSSPEIKVKKIAFASGAGDKIGASLTLGTLKGGNQ